MTMTRPPTRRREVMGIDVTLLAAVTLPGVEERVKVTAVVIHTEALCLQVASIMPSLPIEAKFPTLPATA